MTGKFLLINGMHEQYWGQRLAEALTPLGSLLIGREKELVSSMQQQSYDLFIVDAAAVENVPTVIQCIRDDHREAKIIVVTASPTWTLARAAFRAGAHDYVPKSLSTVDFRTLIEQMLTITPCP